MLKNKKIVLGITGGIAAYKAAELTRVLIKAGAQVRVINDPERNRVYWPAHPANPFTEYGLHLISSPLWINTIWRISRWRTGPTPL